MKEGREMKSIIRMGFVVGCLVAIAAAGVSAQERQSKLNKYMPTAPTKGLQQITPQVSEDVLLRFVDEPSRCFDEAREDFLKKDYVNSAMQIRKGSGFMQLETARATNEGNPALSAAAARLDTLAGKVEKGSVGSIGVLDNALADAEQALANHHESKAEDYWRMNNLGMTGWDLKAASINLRNSLKFMGGKVGPSIDDAIRDAADVGQALIDGADIKDERIGASMANLSDKIDEIGTELQQK
jgi:hypothetical protein